MLYVSHISFHDIKFVATTCLEILLSPINLETSYAAEMLQTVGPRAGLWWIKEHNFKGKGFTVNSFLAKIIRKDAGIDSFLWKDKISYYFFQKDDFKCLKLKHANTKRRTSLIFTVTFCSNTVQPSGLPLSVLMSGGVLYMNVPTDELSALLECLSILFVAF